MEIEKHHNLIALASAIAVNWFGIGFYVDGFWPAFWGALISSIVSVILSALIREDDYPRKLEA